MGSPRQQRSPRGRYRPAGGSRSTSSTLPAARPRRTPRSAGARRATSSDPGPRAPTAAGVAHCRPRTAARTRRGRYRCPRSSRRGGCAASYSCACNREQHSKAWRQLVPTAFAVQASVSLVAWFVVTNRSRGRGVWVTSDVEEWATLSVLGVGPAQLARDVGSRWCLLAATSGPGLLRRLGSVQLGATA